MPTPLRCLSRPCILLAAGLVPALLAAPAPAAIVDFDTDLTDSPGVTAIAGHHTADDGTRGTDYTQFPQASGPRGDAATVIDNDSGTFMTTHQNNESTFAYDYVGVLFDGAQSDIAAVRLYHRTFGDGGWFAYPGLEDTGASDAVSIHPRVQVTTDGGVTWIEVTGADDDYATVIHDTSVPSNGNKAAVTFLFDAVSGINGIRVFGDGHGPAGNDTTGFIGVNEFEVFAVPEPASLALLVAGGLVMTVRRRR